MSLESEFAGKDGASGLPKDKRPSRMRASEKLRLLYTTGRLDPSLPRDPRVFKGSKRADGK